MIAVRSATSPWRVRCSAQRICWSSLLIAAKRMAGREAASQITSASTKSFLLVLTKDLTYWGEISRTSCPNTWTRRAH